jgi:WD40 repeat protein
VSPSETRALVELLTSLFTTDELYRLATFLPHGNLTAVLPSGTASLEAVAFEMVQALERRGQIDEEFFARLEAERPGRTDDISRLRTQIRDARSPSMLVTTPAQAPPPAVGDEPSARGAASSEPRQPDIIDFAGERGRHEHFFGRQDVLHELDEWLRSRQSGWLLLTGSPGLGKSAIFNHWLGLRQRAGLPTAFHFIRRGIHNWAEPSAVRASLAAQIERDFPDQRDAAAAAQHRLEQLLHRVSPVLELRQQQLVLLVDGLDEAMTLGGADNPIPRIFPHELPTRVFVFASSRPLYPHLDWFTRRTGALVIIDLDNRSGNLETVRAFWTALAGTLSSPPADDLVLTAIERSQGNLLHAVKLHQLWSQPGAQRSIEAIPQGFEGMLHELWERLGNLPEEQWAIARQGLSLLCAARQALPLGVIDELLEWGEGKARHKLLPLVREFLHEEHWQEQTAYRPFHEGIRELIARELPETLREHHLRLAGFAAWPSTGSEFRRSYALRHRVVHQIAAGRFEEAEASCLDVDYLTEKACALGLLEVERDIQRAARAQRSMAREDLGTLALAIGLCSHWARQAPQALPALLHDRLLSYAPELHRRLVWPARLHVSGPLLRHPLQSGSLAGVLAGHHDLVVAVAVLPDGRVVSGSSDGIIQVFDGRLGGLCATHTGHKGSVLALAALSGSKVVSSSSDGIVRVWDVHDGSIRATLEGHQGPVLAVGVLRDGRIVSGSSDNTLRIWDASSGQTLAILEGHRGSVLAVRALSDGRIVSGSSDNTLRIWDPNSGRTLAILEGHQGEVTAVAELFGFAFVSASQDKTLRVWDSYSGQTRAILKGHQGGVMAVAVLPDDRIVSGSQDKTLRIWHHDSSEVLATLEGHHGPVSSLAVLPAGGVVSGSHDQTLRFWHLEEKRVSKVWQDNTTHALPERATSNISEWYRLDDVELKGHQRRVIAIATLPSGHVISGSHDRTLRLWNVDAGQTIDSIAAHERRVTAVAASSDGRVVSGSYDKTLRVWSIEPRFRIGIATVNGCPGEVTAVAVLPDGRMVSGSEDSTVRIWANMSWPQINLEDHQGRVSALAALPDGRVVSASADHTLRVWDVESGKALATLEGHRGPVSTVTVLPDGRVVSGSEDNTLRVWNVASRKCLATLKGHDGPVWAVAALPDGCIVSASSDMTLRIWDIKFRKPRTTLIGHGHMVRAMVVLPDGRIVSGSDTELRVWDVVSEQLPTVLSGQAGGIAAMATLPDGRIVVSRDKTLWVWDVDSRRALPLQGHGYGLMAVAVLPDGRVVSGGSDSLCVWDVESGRVVANFRGHHRILAVLPDGRLVSVTGDRTLRVWGGDLGKPLATLEGHQGPVSAVATLADGRIVSGSHDQTLRIWDIESGQMAATLEGHQGPVLAVAALPDGRIVSGSRDRTLRVWDVDFGQATAILEGHKDEIMAVAAFPDGRIVSASIDKTLRIWNVESGQTIAFVYGDTSFRSVAVVSQHLIVAGDGAGNVWFIDVPSGPEARDVQSRHLEPARTIGETSTALERPRQELRNQAPRPRPSRLSRLWHSVRSLLGRLRKRQDPASRHDAD